MREALTLALQEIEAAVVVVSHDRHLLAHDLRRAMAGGKRTATAFDGDLDDYAAWLAKQRNASRSSGSDKASEKQQRLATRQASDTARKTLIAERRALTKEVDRLEQQIAQWQTEKSQLDQRLADPELYAEANRADLAGLLKRQAELAARIDPAETRWLEIHSALEALPGALPAVS